MKDKIFLCPAARSVLCVFAACSSRFRLLRRVRCNIRRFKRWNFNHVPNCQHACQPIIACRVELCNPPLAIRRYVHSKWFAEIEIAGHFAASHAKTMAFCTLCAIIKTEPETRCSSYAYHSFYAYEEKYFIYFQLEMNRNTKLRMFHLMNMNISRVK